jgi:hypothetical protein
VGLTCGFITMFGAAKRGFWCGVGRLSSVLMRPQWLQMALTQGFSPLAARPSCRLPQTSGEDRRFECSGRTAFGADLHA